MVRLIRITQKGDFKKITKFIDRMKRNDMYKRLDALCQEGVSALSDATPIDTGLTASSWSYKIEMAGESVVVTWSNSNFVNGYCVAMLIQYGHGTRGRTYVFGIDYINPAMKPVFNDIANQVWREVTRA